MSENFCRPGCSTRTPRPSQVTFYATAAAALADGWLPCPRCRPEHTCGRPAWWCDDDVACRAMRLIADGEVGRSGINGLAGRVGVSARQVRRAVTAVADCGPLAVARARRVMMARLLLAGTVMPVAEVAVAAGFTTTRQFNAAIRQFYRTSPSRLRPGPSRRVNGGPGAAAGRWHLRCRMPVPRVLQPRAAVDALTARTLPEVEFAEAGSFARTVRLPRATGYVRLDVDSRGRLWASLTVTDARDMIALYARARALAGLDAGLCGAPTVGGRPIPGCADPTETLMRGVIEWHAGGVGTEQARQLLSVLVNALGEVTPWGLLFPTPERVVAEAVPVLSASVPASGVNRIVALADGLTGGELDVHYGLSRRGLGAVIEPYVGHDAAAADTIAARILGRESAHAVEARHASTTIKRRV